MAFNSFEKLLQSNYYNDIFKAVDNYIIWVSFYNIYVC